MSPTEIGVTGMALSGVLIVVAIAVSMARRLGLERSITGASVRAIVQLLVVGVALGLVVDDDDPIILSIVWVVLMVLYASWTVSRRAPEVPNAFPLGVAAFAAATIVGLGILFGLGVFEPTGRVIVPITGMLIGNGLNATVLAARRIVAEATEHRDLVEGRLALGLTAKEAFAPHLRSALRTALVPQIETTKSVGIVFLPGAMVGLILAGVEPRDAVQIQVAVMFLVLGSVATTSSVMALGLTRRLFTSDERLIRLSSVADEQRSTRRH